MGMINRQCLAACLALVAAFQVHAQAQTGESLSLVRTAADVAAAAHPQRVTRHLLAPVGKQGKRETSLDVSASPVKRAAAVPYPVPRVRNVGTLTYQGGPVVASAVEHAIYLIPSNGECPNVSACWGNPEQFLKDLGKSEFIHVSDQYVGTTANGRYTVGVSGKFKYTIPANPLLDADIQAVVHAMVVKDGGLGGYGHEYHVFLPPGQDECFDSTYSACASNAFCAYHGSVDFSDIGHVIYSVEPWAGVPGCAALQPDGTTPSTQYSILSHEFIESITDPDGDAWWNASGNLDLFGYEIGDECQWLYFSATSAGFLLDPVYLNGALYYVQSEYNNQANGCTDGPVSADN